MKSPTIVLPLRCSLLLLTGLTPVWSQQAVVGSISTPVTAVATDVASPNSRPIPETPVAQGLAQSVTMNLKWNDARAGFRFPVQNASDKPLKIEGVQSSGDLFVVSFPGTIPPRGSDDIFVTLDAQPGTSSERDVIRLKTNQGIKTFVVTHTREKIATLDRTELSWAAGEAGEKSVIITVAGAVTKITKARAYGGASVTLTDLGEGRQRVAVTPKSTTAPAAFPVILEFDPALPGATPVISCTVGTKG